MVMLYDADGWMIEGVLAFTIGDIVPSGATSGFPLSDVIVDDWGSAGRARPRPPRLHLDYGHTRT
jgi:hypothetical protein